MGSDVLGNRYTERKCRIYPTRVQLFPKNEISPQLQSISFMISDITACHIVFLRISQNQYFAVRCISRSIMTE